MKIKSAPALQIKLKISLRSDDNLRDTGHYSEPTAITTHDLHHKCSRVAECRRIDVVYGFTYAKQGSGCTDRESCHGHVIID